MKIICLSYVEKSAFVSFNVLPQSQQYWITSSQMTLAMVRLAIDRYWLRQYSLDYNPALTMFNSSVSDYLATAS